MIKSFIYKIWFSLLNSDTQTINDREYCLHHNSYYSCYGMIRHGGTTVFGYTDSFDEYELKNSDKINNLYKLLLNAKHIFLSYDLCDCYITIHDKKYGWITYQYCHRNNCLKMHLYNYCVIYEIIYVFNLNKSFSLFLNNLTDIEEKHASFKNIDFS